MKYFRPDDRISYSTSLKNIATEKSSNSISTEIKLEDSSKSDYLSILALRFRKQWGLIHFLACAVTKLAQQCVVLYVFDIFNRSQITYVAYNALKDLTLFPIYRQPHIAFSKSGNDNSHFLEIVHKLSTNFLKTTLEIPLFSPCQHLSNKTGQREISVKCSPKSQ